MTPDPMVETAARFWLVLHEPGCAPELKGPWTSGMKDVVREFIAARPTAYIDLLNLDSLGNPVVSHGPEVLQMFDGRSMNTGRKHNKRTREAHAAYHAALPELVELREALEEAEEALERVDAEGLTHYMATVWDALTTARAALNHRSKQDGK